MDVLEILFRFYDLLYNIAIFEWTQRVNDLARFLGKKKLGAEYLSVCRAPDCMELLWFL